MKNTELRKLLDRHGLTQKQMAEMLGIHERTMRRYCSGELDIPPHFDAAIRWNLQEMKK